MERLLQMDVERYVERMLPVVRQELRRIAEAVNRAPDGQVIDGSEMQVREVVAQLGNRAFEEALQMRVDQTEGAFSPSQGRVGEEQAE